MSEYAEQEKFMRRNHLFPFLLCLLLGSLVGLGGCASLPEGTQRSEDDPWERYNRSIYQFNDAVDSAVLRPVAKGYDYITPDPVQNSIGNFFDNLSYPVTILNVFLQGKFVDGLAGLGRFVVNTTIGFGGIFDPATELGLEADEEDFGQTLAVWGVPDGPYFMLPFFGPSTVRDTAGLAGDIAIDPVWQNLDIDDDLQYSLLALNIIHMRAELLSIDQQLRDAFDPYTFLRDAYLQRREFQVHDGNPPQDQYDDLYDDLYDFEDMPPPPAEDPADIPAASDNEQQEEPSPAPGAGAGVGADEGNAPGENESSTDEAGAETN